MEIVEKLLHKFSIKAPFSEPLFVRTPSRKTLSSITWLTQECTAARFPGKSASPHFLVGSCLSPLLPPSFYTHTHYIGTNLLSPPYYNDPDVSYIERYKIVKFLPRRCLTPVRLHTARTLRRWIKCVRAAEKKKTSRFLLYAI